MKILLIEPPKAPLTIGGEDVFLFEPLALEYLAAAMSSHHDVEILDMRIDPDLDAALDRLRPDIVGITGYTVHVNVVRRLAARIKDWDPVVLTVVGGHHATVRPLDFDTPHIDLVVVGEGVSAFRAIVERHEHRSGFAGLSGVPTRLADGTLARVPAAPVADLDSCPFPDRSITAAYRSRYYCEWMQPLASIRTSKGCPFRCSFCAQWKIAGGQYLRRDPERVVAELATIDEPFVFFADDESLVDVRRMTRLAELIDRAGIDKRYFLYGRSDTIAMNWELLERWRDVGLERVFVGLEFFRDDDLRHIRKSSTIDDNERAVRILQQLGIDIYASFIVRPEFGRSDFDQLRAYCRRLGLDFATFAVLTPLPGTDLWDEVEDLLLTDNWELFDFIHTTLPTTLPLPEFHKAYQDLYRKAVPLGKQLAAIRRYPLREVPALMRRASHVHQRLRDAHLDYGDERLGGAARRAAPPPATVVDQKL